MAYTKWSDGTRIDSVPMNIIGISCETRIDQHCFTIVNVGFVSPEVLIESIHWQKVNIRQKHVGCVDLPHSNIAQEVNRVELAFFIDYVVSHVASAHQDLRALSVSQKLLGFSV